MTISLSQNEVRGRMIAAARMLSGFDQAKLGKAAGVTASTVSNVENGHDVRDDTYKSIRKALRENGVSVTFDKTNGLVAVSLVFEEPDDDDF